MGPRSIDRGNSLPLILSIQMAHSASMGPRSIDRGNVLEMLAMTDAQLALQWGRDQLIAETRRWSGKWDLRYFSLQWGRDQLIAETPP